MKTISQNREEQNTRRLSMHLVKVPRLCYPASQLEESSRGTFSSGKTSVTDRSPIVP